MRLTVCAAVIIVLLFRSAVAAPESEEGGFTGVPVFQTPEYVATERTVAILASQQRWKMARQTLEAIVKRWPRAPRPHLALARYAALSGQSEEAIRRVEAAARLGAPNLTGLLGKPPFDALADDPRLAAALASAPSPARAHTATPAPVVDGVAMVAEGNSAWRQDLGAVVPLFDFDAATMAPTPKNTRLGQAAALLARWRAEGRAAGNLGDLYDNRDGGHSLLKPVWAPNLASVGYGPAAIAAGLHYGINQSILFNAVTFGNSSTAIKGAQWRSQPRHALTAPGGPAALWRQYVNNHIYVYPEHRDHDPVEAGGKGDLFPANTPYMLISQGSSGSDQQLMRAVQSILAGFRPEVKAFLRERKLIAPTVQQVFRRGMLAVDDAATYLTGAAHPTVFNGAAVSLSRMIRLANAITMESIPPLARFRVAAEPKDEPALRSAITEVMFDTPAAAARLWRSPAPTRRYVLDAGASSDPNGRPLSYHWRVLRGDADRITLRQLDADGARVEVVIPWHEDIRAPGEGGLRSRRVEIGLFTHNGAAYSAPAFFNLAIPVGQTRTIATGPDGSRTESVAYRKSDVYADPRLWPLRRWSDHFIYDDDGRALGWIRRHEADETRFSPHGLIVRETDASGRPTIGEQVRYAISGGGARDAYLTAAPTGRLFAYDYLTDTQTVGAPRPLPAASE